MNANAEKSLIGMALFAFIDAVIVYFANRYALPFSIMWWCAMWISRFCNRIYNSKQVKPIKECILKDFLISFMGNFLILVILGK